VDRPISASSRGSNAELFAHVFFVASMHRCTGFGASRMAHGRSRPAAPSPLARRGSVRLGDPPHARPPPPPPPVPAAREARSRGRPGGLREREPRSDGLDGVVLATLRALPAPSGPAGPIRDEMGVRTEGAEQEGAGPVLPGLQRRAGGSGCIPLSSTFTDSVPPAP
jgi:hypothetical protein